MNILNKRIRSSKSPLRFSLSAGMLLLVFMTAACGPLSDTPETAPDTPPSDLRPVQVEAVTIETGVGSPIPLEIVAAGTWPDLCAQLSEVRQRIDGFQIQVDLQATPENQDCPPDQLGVPFRLAIPLNPVELPPGAYTVSVNGVSASFEWPTQ